MAFDPSASITATNVEQAIRSYSVDIANAMPRILGESRNEEDVRQSCTELLKAFLRGASLPVPVFHEYGLAGGRVDSKYGGVIVEYKNPHTSDRIDLSMKATGTRKAISQIESRFEDFEREERLAKARIFACGLDGRNIIFVRHRGSAFEVEEPQPITQVSVERLLRALVSLGATGHSYGPENLVRDFGADSQTAKTAVQALYHAILSTTSAKAKTFFEQWKILFGEVCGYDVGRTDARIVKLGAHYDIPTPQSAELLFAVHTYYSIFIKFLASEIIASFAGFAVSTVKRCCAAATTSALRREVADLEQGGKWKSWGVNNFLEGDLFAWYVQAWSEEVASGLRSIATAIDNYDPSTLSIDPGESRDLLKKLYQQLFPQSVRHDLGEYYTPDWLAEKVLDRLEFDGDPRKRVLDPTCGSGTFLVSVINRAKRWFEENRDSCGFDEAKLIDLILSNVVGFELNPLAVMAARTNYLLAIREFIKLRASIEIPVYLCDSVMTPAEYGALFTSVKRLKTAVGEFIIPSEVSSSSHELATYADVLEKSVESDYSAEEFLEYCGDQGLSVGDKAVNVALYKQIHALNKASRNGIWARIIKNSFAPLFTEPFDYVCGNPPWINWESLPTDYRTSLIPIWRRYQLFTLSGTAGRMGGGKKDMSMLVTYVAFDKYLRTGGKLGFLITRSVFKTQGAGDGFRRLQYDDGPNRIRLKPVLVDDLSNFQVFEGATNQTAVCTLQKTRSRFNFPIPYVIWQGRGRIRQEATPADVAEQVSELRVGATPVNPNIQTSPWLTVPTEAIEPCQKIVGKTVYSAQAGCTTWLNGVYWIEIVDSKPGGLLFVENLHDIGKKKVAKQSATIESTYVFPLLRGEDVNRWSARPSKEIIVPQDPVTRKGIPELRLKREARRTHAYLNTFRSELLKRSGLKKYFRSTDAFYSVYNVDRQTFAEHKVAWRDMGYTIQAAVVENPKGRIACPEHHVMFIPVRSADEAHYICALLNSAPVQLLVAGYTTNTGISTHVADLVRIPPFSEKSAAHQCLIQLSRACHALHAAGDSKGLQVQTLKIDLMAAECWSLTRTELKTVYRAMEALTA